MPNIIEGVQKGLRRIGDAAKNARVDYDINPFNDSKVGISVRSGRHQLNIGIGVDAEQGAGEADKLGEIGINANVSRDGVGSVGIGVGIGGKSGLLPDPELTIKNAQDISVNNPNNKPRINQPTEGLKPLTAYRMLTPREKQLFDCIQNGGGDACNKKYGESPQANASGNSGGNSNEISLNFGDPYIGLGEF
ncbi:hypothetical protein [Kamptonema formosum]|uniref:hypothetical protein n=1 Tax=Kamptonema formosum TaxID=331992 RepID=UPI0003794D0B|nr:hypothetical protein [Kamptonema formosum]